MSNSTPFPSLAGAAATIETLHWYAKGVGAIPRAFGERNEGFAHPKWWHISLRVTERGLETLPMPLADGGTFKLAMDMRSHNVRLTSSAGLNRTFSMAAGQTATAFGRQLGRAVAEDLGLMLELNESKFADTASRVYDRQQAETFLTVIQSAQTAFAGHIAAIDGEIGPIQLWPHGFDVAVEWFGTRVVTHEEHGQVSTYPSQINLGFSPGESSHPEPYFYSNPWPFETAALQDTALPAGHWRLDPNSWQGSLLEYADVVAAADGAALVRAYARAVYDAAAPTLMA